ncbi:hypothetical protein ACHWQZ_G002147 [Mnemiopsis leidyi]
MGRQLYLFFTITLWHHCQRVLTDHQTRAAKVTWPQPRSATYHGLTPATPATTVDMTSELMDICYYTETPTCLGDDCNITLDQFSSDTLEQCSEYCRYFAGCNYLAYRAVTSQCFLFPEPPSLPFNSTVYGESQCMREVEMSGRDPLKIVRKIYFGKLTPEVLIKNLHTSKCLNVVDYEPKRLSWGSCSNSSIWEITPVTFKETWKVIVKHAQSQKCIKASPTMFGVTATLAKCTKNPAQILEVLNMLWESYRNPYMQYFGLELSKRYQIIYFCDDCTGTLQNVTFESIRDHKQPCQKDIEQGEILSKTSGPFFLPGSIIEVRCNPGYQVDGAEVTGNTGATHSNSTHSNSAHSNSSHSNVPYQFVCQNAITDTPVCVRREETSGASFSSLFGNRYLCLCICIVLFGG